MVYTSIFPFKHERLCMLCHSQPHNNLGFHTLMKYSTRFRNFFFWEKLHSSQTLWPTVTMLGLGLFIKQSSDSMETLVDTWYLALIVQTPPYADTHVPFIPQLQVSIHWNTIHYPSRTMSSLTHSQLLFFHSMVMKKAWRRRTDPTSVD